MGMYIKGHVKPFQVMAGDYVKHEKFGVVEIIEAHTTSPYFIVKDMNEDVHLVLVGTLFPIPITTEFLEKNGFERIPWEKRRNKNGHVYDWKWKGWREELWLKYYETTDDYTIFNDIVILRYVHDLQQAARLLQIYKNEDSERDIVIVP